MLEFQGKPKLNAFIRRFSRYFMVGGMSAIIDWTLFALFYYLGGIHYRIAAVCSFSLAFLFNFFTGRKFAYAPTSRGAKRELMLVLFVSLVGLGINDQILRFCVENLSFEEMIGKVVATAVTFVWNFSARHFWIYREITTDDHNGR
ncbi:MAG: GtrA family protein [Proteobacteria bacterium]|jgi:putative flippase GtrA|nr:GtrA family protein [Pseudomonadota bacterium]